MFIRAVVIFQSGDSQHFKQASDDLQYAITCLGKEGAVDFLDSSLMGLNILDYYININATEFLTYEEYTKQSPRVVPPPDEFGSIYYHAPPMGDWRYRLFLQNELDN